MATRRVVGEQAPVPLCYNAAMPERLLQLGFDAQFKPAVPQDVTPENFQGLGFEQRGSLLIPKPELARFVREVADPTQVNLAADAANYLIDHIYTPFEAFDQEEAWVLLLNTKNLITHEAMVYRGVVDSLSLWKVGDFSPKGVARRL